MNTRNTDTGLIDVTGRPVRLGDIVDYDFEGDDPCPFEVVFENGAYRKAYKKWNNTLPKPLLDDQYMAEKMRYKVVKPAVEIPHELRPLVEGLQTSFVFSTRGETPSPWQLIDTAPKDGTQLWLFIPTDDPQQVQGYYYPPENDLPGYWQYTEELVANVMGEAKPTHWQPLAQPPTQNPD